MQAKKILLTTDLSEESLRAFLPIAAFAGAQGGSVTLLHIVEDVPIIAHGAHGSPPLHTPSLPDLIARAEERIAEQAAELPKELPTDTAVFSAPHVAEAVATYAKDNHFDLIALSSHGRSGFKRLFLGSVAEQLLRHATIPVLVFPRN